ncbi:MMPL family transporter [Kitasatospora sp. NPDC096140]|uniref:MMPL family transporter n=1 Tax=unclassified Kitasatospora TaxID=2633591 RepID=UPI0033272219
MSGSSKSGGGFLGLPGSRVGKWLVLVAWIIATVVSVPLGAKLSGVEKNSVTVELARGAESTNAANAADNFPDAKISNGIVVYVRDSGVTEADKAKAEADRKAFGDWAVGPVQAVSTSSDGRALSVVVPLDSNTTKLPVDAEKVRDQATGNLPDGLTAKLTGPAGSSLDAADAAKSTGHVLTLVTIVVVAGLLLYTYRSPSLWLLPLLTVGFAFALSRGLTYVMAEVTGVTVDSGNGIVVTALLFGVGTDYAMLLLARYREELYEHEDRHVAMKIALRRSVPAIGASAATVAIALLCLLAADMGFNYTFGPAGTLAVICGFIAMTTLLPALLVILGRWIFWPAIPRPGAPLTGRRAKAARNGTVWDRIGTRISRRPRTVWLTSALLLGVVAFGSVGIKTGLDDAHVVTGKPGSVAGQELLAAHFPAGRTKPVIVISDTGAATAVAAAVKGVDGVAEVSAPKASNDGSQTMVRAVLKDAADSPAAVAAVERIRTAAHAVPGSNALIGGPTAIEQDKEIAQAHDRKLVIPLVLAVVFLILIVLLRALVAPVLLMLTVVLSYFAALGISWQLFDKVFHFPAVDIQVMLMAFLFLVALGVDYNIFLLHRIREEVGALGHADGIRRGLSATGGVITSAGAVLVATFGALTASPQTAFIEIGTMVALGVLIDTFLVRSVLVPALAIDTGRKFWWPGRLSRLTGGPGSVAQDPAPLSLVDSAG